MLLPRICTSLPPFLPRLFYIFARALCWDQLRDIRRKQGQSADRTTQAQAKQAAANDWDCAGKHCQRGDKWGCEKLMPS